MRLSKQGKCLLDGPHVGDSIHPSTEAYTFLSVRGKFLVNSTLKNFQYLDGDMDEDTDIPEQFLNTTTYEEIVLISGSAKGGNNLNGNSLLEGGNTEVLQRASCWCLTTERNRKGTSIKQ